MANIRSAEKRNRQAQKRRARNLTVRTAVKSAIKMARQAIASKDSKKAQEALREAARVVNKAASKGVIHAGNASRHLSRLAKSLHAAISTR